MWLLRFGCLLVFILFVRNADTKPSILLNVRNGTLRIQQTTRTIAPFVDLRDIPSVNLKRAPLLACERYVMGMTVTSVTYDPDITTTPITTTPIATKFRTTTPITTTLISTTPITTTPITTTPITTTPITTTPISTTPIPTNYTNGASVSVTVNLTNDVNYTLSLKPVCYLTFGKDTVKMFLMNSVSVTWDFLFNETDVHSVLLTCSEYFPGNKTTAPFSQTVRCLLHESGECCTNDDFFEPTYKNSDTPLVVFDQDELRLTANLCLTSWTNLTSTFLWKITNISALLKSANETNVDNFTQPESWYLALPAGTLSPGSYAITLTVYCGQDKISYDYVFVKVIAYEVTAQISGGSLTTAALGKSLLVDATKSTDRSRLGAVAYWSVLSFSPDQRLSNFYDQLETFRLTFQTDPVKSETSIPVYGRITYEYSQGDTWNLKIDTNFFPSDTYLIVLFSLSSPNSSASAMQVIHVVENALPLSIRFLYNTNAERFTSEKVMVETYIPDNVRDAVYEWTIWRRNSNDVNWFDISNILQSTIGYNQPSLILKENQFEAPFLYKLVVSVTANGYNKAVIEEVRHGNGKYLGGYCTLHPALPGRYSYLDWFTLRCADWVDVDPGINDLGYPEYSVYQNIDYDGYEDTEPVIKSAVGQVGSIPLMLKPGHKDAGYYTTVLIQITDTFGDFTELSITLQVLPNLQLLSITDVEDGSPIIEVFLDDVKRMISSLELVQQLFYMAQILSSAAQLIVSVPLSEHEPPVERVLSMFTIMDIGLMSNTFDDLGSALGQNMATVNDSLPAVRRVTDYLTNTLKNVSALASSDKMLLTKLYQIITILFQHEKPVSSKSADILTEISELLSELLQDSPGKSGDISGLSDADSELMFCNLQTNIGHTVPNIMKKLKMVENLIIARKQIKDMIEMRDEPTDVMSFSLSPDERSYLYSVVQGDVEYTKYNKAGNAKKTAKYMGNAYRKILSKLWLCRNCKNGPDNNSKKCNKSKKPSILKFPGDQLVNKTLDYVDSHLMYDNLTEQDGSAKTTNRDMTTVSVSELCENVYMYDKEDEVSSIVSSNVLKLDIESAGQYVIPGYVVFEQMIMLPAPTLTSPVIDPDDASEMSLHKFIYQSKTDSVCILLEPVDLHAVYEYTVYIRYRQAPTLIDYDALVVVDTYSGWSKCFSRHQLRGHVGLTHLGIRVPGNVKNVDYNLTLITVACLNWDEAEAKWVADRCDLEWLPREGKIRCSCRNIREPVFANSFYAPPNSIDFSTVFLKFSPLSQAAVMGTLASITIVYIIVVVFLRRMDLNDVLKWGITPLVDNLPCDEYFYIITVYTGMRRNAGTTSKIKFILTGNDNQTNQRKLSDGVRQHTTGSCVSYLMSTGKSIGPLEHMRIWLDIPGQGEGSTWYLSQIEVYDVIRQQKYTFLAERWFSLVTGLEADIQATGTQTRLPFENRFFIQTRDRLADSHLFVSILYRPSASMFTRVQRASCALVYLLLLMLANAVYFNPDENYEKPPLLQLGPFRFTGKQIYVSLISALMTTPAVMLIATLFKYSRPWSQTGCVSKICGGCCQGNCFSGSCCCSCCHSNRKQVYVEDELQNILLTKDIPITSGSCTLPVPFRFVAWLLVLLCISTAGFFVMLYSMEWGKQKSEEWLTSFFLSFFESVMFIDPIMVICIAFLLACVFRKQTFDKGAYFDKVINKYMTQQQQKGNIDYRHVLAMLRTVTRDTQINGRTPQKDIIKKQRYDYVKEVKSMQLFWQFLMLLILLGGISVVAYGNKDTRSIYLRQDLINRITPVNGLHLEKVTTQSQYFSWLNRTIIPALFPEFDVQGHLLHWSMRIFTSGLLNYRLGPPRLRQLRIKREKCRVPHSEEMNCYPGYQILEEEVGEYCLGWSEQENGTCPKAMRIYNITTPAWSFISGLDIWGLPIVGSLTGYGGGGYIAEWNVNRNISIKVLNELYNNHWIDRSTRAVALEFTIFNVATNLFMYCEFLTEFGEMGGLVNSYSLYPVKLFTNNSDDLSLLIGEILSIIYMVMLFVKIIINLYNYRLKFFKSFWMLFDLFIFLCGMASIFVFVMRQIFASMTLERFYADKKSFVNFAHIVFWDRLVATFIGLLTFLCTIRVLEIFATSKRLQAIAAVLRTCRLELLWFSLTFIQMFLAFCFMALLLFGSSLDAFRSIYKCMTTLFLAVLGKNRFNEMNDASPILAKVFFFLYTLAVIMFVMTIFMSILCASVDDSIHEMRKRKQIDVLDVWMKKLLKLVRRSRPKIQSTEMSPGGNWNSSKHTGPRFANIHVHY